MIMKLARSAKFGIIFWLVLLVTAVVWMVMSAQNLRIASYAECVKSNGSVIQDSYPSVCITARGQRFTNSDEHVTLPGSLAIREWGVALPLAHSVSDAYYTYDGEKDQIFLTTPQLEQQRKTIQGCNAGLHGLYYKRVNGHLEEQHQIEILCAPLANAATERIAAIQKELRAAAEAAKF
jgi:hypothetical protein